MSSKSKMTRSSSICSSQSTKSQAPFLSISPNGFSMATNQIQPEQMLLSPPVSPETNKAIPQYTRTLVDNPKLYQVDLNTYQNVSQKSGRSTRVFQIPLPTHTSEYGLAVELKSQLRRAIGIDSRRWVRRELAQLKEDSRLRSESRFQNAPSTNLRKRERSSGKKLSSSRIVTLGSKAITKKVSKTRTRKNAWHGETGERTKRVAREDKDFVSLSDHCPPLCSLPKKANCLKVDWKGAALDLRSDPFVHLLHSDEVQLAASLRLDCATYLTSKRRIFISRLAAHKIGKEFRKTDAQQACKIDVNKASKLWQAFEKVGWFDEKWINH